MDWKLYTTNCYKTLSSTFNTAGIQNQLHCAVGIVTEAGEIQECFYNPKDIDLVHLSEEIGDIDYYFGILCNELKIDIEDLKYEDFGRKTPSFFIIMISISCSQILDYYKKVMFYGDVPADKKAKYEDRLKNGIEKLNSALFHLCQFYKFDRGEIHQKNIEKLRARYGDIFVSTKAHERNLKKERKILEGK